MTELEFAADGRAVPVLPAATLSWIDPGEGLAVLEVAGSRHRVLLEGGPREWVCTLDGRRIAVLARSWRDRILAETGGAATRRPGRAEVRASLPGLIVRVLVTSGDLVAEGEALLTIEAMKMQNEIRAPRDGRVASVAVVPGQSVSRGELLVRLE